MATLFEQIRGAVASDRFVVGKHAAQRLESRRITEWQIIEGVQQGRLLAQRPNDQPNPVVEIEQILADGTVIKAVWAWLRYNKIAKLVTVHFFDQ